MRSELLDRRTAPIENLLPNPSMERVQPGTMIVRRNLAPNPAAATASGWSAIGGGTGVNYTGALITGGGPTAELSNFYRTTKTVLESSGSSWLRVQYGANAGSTYAVPVVPRRVYTFSVFGRWLSPTATAIVIIAVFRTTANQPAQVAEVVGTNRVDLGNGWYRYYVTAVAPVDAANAYIHFGVTALSKVGDTVDATGAMIEERPALLPFFHGGTVNDRGIAYAWDGVAHASSSNAKASVTEFRRNHAYNPDAITGGQAWQTQVPNGYTVTPYFEPTPAGSDALSCAALSVDTSDGTIQQFRLRVGGSGVNISPLLNAAASVTVTLSFDFWASSLLVNKVISVELPVQGPGGSTFRNSFTFTPTVEGWSRVEATIVAIPQQTVTGIDYFQHPQIVTPYIAVPAGTILFRATKALIEITSIKGLPYFSGNVTPDADMTPAWAGTVNAGTSTLSLALVNRLGGMNIIRAASFQYPGELRVLNLNTASDTCARIDLLPYVREGQTYTVLAKLKIRQLHSAAIAPIQGTQRRSLFLDISGGGGNTRGWGATNPSPNVVGEYIHRVTFTVPAVNGSPVTGLGARLYNGGALGDASMYWDEAMLVPGTYTGPYIDGDKRGSIWRDVPHDSGSVGYPLAA